MVYRANIHEAKTHFSKLLKRAHEGEEVIIAKAGQDYVRLVPIHGEIDRSPGAFAGRIAGDIEGGTDAPDDGSWG
ncbi:MAG: type II toxin-antitoxin system prevent-host-death family antitoxin [Myxococcota bacterium]